MYIDCVLVSESFRIAFHYIYKCFCNFALARLRARRAYRKATVVRVCKNDAKRRTRMPTKIRCFVGVPIGHPTRELKKLKKHYKNSMNRSEMLPGRLVHDYSVWGNASKSSTFIIFIVRARSPTDNILYVC